MDLIIKTRCFYKSIELRIKKIRFYEEIGLFYNNFVISKKTELF